MVRSCEDSKTAHARSDSQVNASAYPEVTTQAGYHLTRPEDLRLLPAIELAVGQLLRGHAAEPVLNEATDCDKFADAARRPASSRAGSCGVQRRGSWYAAVVIEFCDEGVAIRFERYLKSGSGRAFAKRHFSSA
jgi:hypothetical protein